MNYSAVLETAEALATCPINACRWRPETQMVSPERQKVPADWREALTPGHGGQIHQSLRSQRVNDAACLDQLALLLKLIEGGLDYMCVFKSFLLLDIYFGGLSDLTSDCPIHRHNRKGKKTKEWHL